MINILPMNAAFANLILFLTIGSFALPEGGTLCKRVDKVESTQKEEEEDIYEVQVKGVGIDRFSKSPIVLLYESKNSKIVPIWIGYSEAQSINMVLNGQVPPRPLTHDLIRNIIQSLNGKVKRITVTEVKNNTFYAIITVVVGDGKEIKIDSRPSDAIAIALRTKSPIYISKEILDMAVSIPFQQQPFQDVLWNKVGVSVQNLDEGLSEFFKVKKGVLVSDIRDDSPAQKSLKRGDVIVSANGKVIEDVEALEKIVAESDSIEFEIIREEKKEKIKILRLTETE